MSLWTSVYSHFETVPTCSGCFMVWPGWGVNPQPTHRMKGGHKADPVAMAMFILVVDDWNDLYVSDKSYSEFNFVSTCIFDKTLYSFWIMKTKKHNTIVIYKYLYNLIMSNFHLILIGKYNLTKLLHYLCKISQFPSNNHSVYVNILKAPIFIKIIFLNKAPSPKI